MRNLCYTIDHLQYRLYAEPNWRSCCFQNIRLFLVINLRKFRSHVFTQGQVGQYVNTMTSDVNGYEQILTHKVSNLTKNIALSVIVIAFISYLYLPAGVILLFSALLLIPEMWLSFRTVKKYGKKKYSFI